jgi:8-oxo-dGTP diphosphatase
MGLVICGGAPDEAVALARRGQAALHAGAVNPALEARMLALEARGVAGKDPAECTRLLLRAERALEGTLSVSVSTSMSHFDEGSLASETTRCLRQLGDLEQARQQAERIISLRPSHRTRSRAFGQLALASVLIAQRGGPLYERDPKAWNAYLAEGNTKQARKRVSAHAIVRDSSGRILLVDPTYKPDWDLPGGMAGANEPPADALCRELREELGLDIKVGNLLCVDWVSPHGPWDDPLNFIFDCGALSSSDIKGLQPIDRELRAFEFCDEGQAKERLRPYVWRRASAALEALETRRARYLQDGCA